MKIVTVKNYEQMSSLAAGMIAKQVREKPDSVLGLATGSSPVGAYERLGEMCGEDGLDFSRVRTFNLDEYCGLDKGHAQSYRVFMDEKLFSLVNIDKGNTHFPSGEEPGGYDRMIEQSGGIDLQVLGVGNNGHIGFNEPDSVFHNLTRVVKLDESTIKANSRFFEKPEDVPATAVSMGIGTIMAAKRIVLVAGADKAHIIKRLQEPAVSPELPVSVLHYHPDCTIIHAEN